MNSGNKNLSYVRFDVGNYLHVCHKNTIEKFGDSVLAKYISPNFDRRTSESEFIIIDRDGRQFGTILNFMRDPTSLNLNNLNESDIVDLKREADFYCLDSLVELCQKQLEYQELERQNAFKAAESKQSEVTIPQTRRLVIIFGYHVLSNVLVASKKQVIVINYHNMRLFQIDHWFEDMINYCNYDKLSVYAFSPRKEDNREEVPLRSILCLYNSETKNFSLSLQAPSEEKFRSKRSSYKCKVYKFWFLVQNDFPARNGQEALSNLVDRS